MQVDIANFALWLSRTETTVDDLYTRTCRIMDAAIDRRVHGIHQEPLQRPCGNCGVPLGHHSQAGSYCPNGEWFSKTARYEPIQ